MRIVVNPTYEHLRGWLEQLPDTFAQQGEVIYNERNQIRTMQAPDGAKVCVKRFHKPRWLNKYLYRFTAGKAKRAYYNGLYLLAHGINTPEPIAYIEEYISCRLGFAYLITRTSQLTHLHREFTLDYRPELDNTIRPLAQYTARMHEAGINHLDFSPGNILWDYVDGEYRFELVDLNRMEIGKPVSLKEGAYSIRRLCARKSFFITFATEYAKARHLNTQECIKWTLYYRDRFWHNGKIADYNYN